MGVDEQKEIRRAVDTGSVLFGRKQSEASIVGGRAKLAVLSSNVEKLVGERIRHLCVTSDVPLYSFNGTSIELGSLCGKPFAASVLAVENPGKSRVLEIVKNKK